MVYIIEQDLCVIKEEQLEFKHNSLSKYKAVCFLS